MALMMLVVVSLLGAVALRISSTEIQIAGNDKLQKQTFYEADGGSQVGARLVEENIACPQGFANDDITVGNNNEVHVAGKQFVNEEDFSLQVDDSNRHAYLPPTYGAGDPHTNLAFASQVGLTAGSGAQSMAGYEGRGRGAAAGGSHVSTDIWSQRVGLQDSMSQIHSQWLHVIGVEGDCNY